VFLRGVREDLMVELDLIVAGDIYQFTYAEIKDLFKNYSRETMRKGRGLKIVLPSTSKNTIGITKAEIGNLIEDMKTNILNSLSMQLDALQTKRKQEENDKSLAIFYPRCTKKHP
jgi:hypothetical protein